MNRLKTKLGKLELKNPITVASGTFGLEYSDFFDLNKLGAIITKTITMKPKAGNKPPRICETSNGFLNSIGLQNPGIHEFISKTLPEYAKLEIPKIISFSGSTIDEFSEMLELLEKEETIDGYEINVSCPNVEEEGMAFGTNPDVVYTLTENLRKITDKELIIKLSPNVTDIATIAKAAESAGADSLALINTLLGMSIDWKTGKSNIGRGIAGYSGPAIKPVALQNIFKVKNAVKIPILGMGGISNWKDCLEFFYSGASAISIGTANFINPTITIETLKKLDKYLIEQDSTVEKYIGKIKL